MKKHSVKLLSLFVISAVVLSSCGGEGMPSGSSSGGSGSGTSSQSKAYGKKTDLQATADLAKVAFVGDGTDLVVDDGSGEKVVYTDEAYSLDGTQWSPDGRYVSFYRVGFNARHELFVCDTLTGKVMESFEEVYGGGGDYQARDIWNADSTKAIYYSDTGGGYYDVSAGKSVEITPEGESFYTASFSPDGSRILYCEGDSKQSAYILKACDVASGKASDIYRFESFNPIAAAPPVWLSDSEVLVFEQMSGKAYRVEVATGKKSEYLTGVNGYAFLSPDRNYLAYKTADAASIRVKNIATGEEKTLKADSSIPVIPVWSYDSQKLLLCSDDAIYIFGLDGKQAGETVKLPQRTDSTAHVSTPVYTKDGLWYEGVKS